MYIQNSCISSCAILQRFIWFFFLVAIFFSLFLKKKSVLFFKGEQKKICKKKKKKKIPSNSLDDFASCHAAVLKLHKFLIKNLLIENVGSYDSLLLHCAPPSNSNTNMSLFISRTTAWEVAWDRRSTEGWRISGQQHLYT